MLHPGDKQEFKSRRYTHQINESYKCICNHLAVWTLLNHDIKCFCSEDPLGIDSGSPLPVTWSWTTYPIFLAPACKEYMEGMNLPNSQAAEKTPWDNVSKPSGKASGTQRNSCYLPLISSDFGWSFVPCCFQNYKLGEQIKVIFCSQMLKLGLNLKWCGSNDTEMENSPTYW